MSHWWGPFHLSEHPLHPVGHYRQKSLNNFTPHTLKPCHRVIICHTLPVQLASTSPKSTLNSHSLQAPQIHRPNRSSSHYPNNQINLTGSSELCQAVPKYLSLQFRSFQPKPVNIYDPTGDHSHLQLRISRSRNRFPKFLTQKFFCNPLFDFYRCSVCQSLTLIFLLEQFCSVDVYLPNLLSALSSEK